MSTSPFPAPHLAPPHASTPTLSKSRSDSGGTAMSTSTSGTTPSMHASIGRKRARNDSPTRDWQDLGSSTGSLYNGGASPGFFSHVGESPALLSTSGFMGSQSFFAPRPGYVSSGPESPGYPSALVSSSYASPGLLSPSFASPSPLAHSRYTLAGGQTTPSLTQSAASDFFFHSTTAAQSTSDLGTRRGRPYHDERNRSVSTTFSVAPSSSEERLPTALSRESNGRARALPDEMTQSGLGRSVLLTVSGAVGRVWNFCAAGMPFRGFFAGGGPGYALEKMGAADDADDRGSNDANVDPLLLPMGKTSWRKKGVLTGSVWQDMASSTTLPGGFPDSPGAGVPESMPSPTTPAVKKIKRAHFDEEDATPAGAGSLTQSWIVVRDGAADAARRKQPLPISASGASPASMRQTPPRPCLRPSSVVANVSPLSRPAHHRTSSAASAAGLRSPTRPAHSRRESQTGHLRRESSHASMQRESTASTHNRQDTTPVTNSSKRASMANPDEKRESPIVTETTRFVKDMRRQERREDRDIRRMNRALEDMIQEAKAALGTTVEVEIEMHEEGREVDMW